MLSFEHFKNNSFCELRTNKRGKFIDNGGWHFSYMGGYDKIKYKIESFGEQSLNQDEVKKRLKSSVDNAIKSNRDLYNRPCKFWIEKLSYETHPKYLVDNQKEFEDFIYKEF